MTEKIKHAIKEKHQILFWTDAETAASLQEFADKSPFLGVTCMITQTKENGAVQIRYYTQGTSRTELNERMIGFFLSYAQRIKMDSLKALAEK